MVMAPKDKASSSSLAPKKGSKTTNTSLNSPPALSRGNRAQSQLLHVINKHGIIFLDDAQHERYEALVFRQINERKYIAIEFYLRFHF